MSGGTQSCYVCAVLTGFFLKRRHFLAYGLEQIIIRHRSQRDVLARTLLQLSIEYMAVSVEHVEDLLANLGEQVEPLDVRRQQQRARWLRAEMRTRVKRMELLDWTCAWVVGNEVAKLAK